MRDVIVVGCGIIGATVSKMFKDAGLDVLTLDAGRGMPGTAASGGHLRREWFGKVSKDIVDSALETLDKVWTLKSEEFQIVDDRTEGKTATVDRVDTDQVLAYPRYLANVDSLTMLHNYPMVRWSGRAGNESGVDRCRLLLVATGVWAAEGFPELDMKARQGISFKVKGELPAPFIKQWAPYKQIVAHQQQSGQIWIGDGTAVMPKNWTSDRDEACARRCAQALGSNVMPTIERVWGIRPYIEHDPEVPCLLRRLGPRAFLATGAGKSGTLAAGWVADSMAEAYRD